MPFLAPAAMKPLPLLRNLLFALLLLAIALWCYGNWRQQPQLVDIALYLGDALVMAGAYLLPTVTAALVKSPRLKRIVLLNLLGGWLILPWIVAMGLALKRDDLA
ncbi:superinfection immunity protein [Chromobacterium sphagni]|uniref:superinfection immunity protein n=1 Tax=Chromobacterium sphagni TaxID=1903179 RepID=UPI00111469B3|nr:superinfection immunity protein [Chromobacterium sphagni]